MKYHYQIVSKSDQTCIHTNSEHFMYIDNGIELSYGGFGSRATADTCGMLRMMEYNLDPDQYYIKIIPVPETVTEEDALSGHSYPGHETWDDSPKTIEEYNRQYKENERLGV